jgi:ABC-type uncharacterized transport system permease subunit
LSFLISIFLAFVVGGVVALVGGENPLEVYRILFAGSFGSLENLSYTLFYATPFIFTGLAVMIPYRAGLFNIGAEGQLYMGAVGLAMADHYLPDCGVFSPFLYVVCAGLVAAAWAGIAGAIRAWRGCHEVITTIMLNFIAMSFSSYLVLSFWKDPTSQRAETPIFRNSSWLAHLPLGESPLNVCFILALMAAFFSWVCLERTTLGFRLRAVGQSPSAARVAGYRVAPTFFLSMCLGGAMAAGAAVNEILGNSHRFLDGFSSGYGFVGIAVAFLGRNHPLGIVISGIFFGALFKGAADLDIESTYITRDFSTVLQALIIAAVASEIGIKKAIAMFRKDRGHAN